MVLDIHLQKKTWMSLSSSETSNEMMTEDESEASSEASDGSKINEMMAEDESDALCEAFNGIKISEKMTEDEPEADYEASDGSKINDMTTEDDEPECFYEASDGSKMPCSLEQAQLWLYRGYFTCDSRFALRGEDGKEEWRTVGEWMERNGREMPFAEWHGNEEEKEKQEEELDKLREEMAKLRERRGYLQRVIVETSRRSAKMQKELNRMARNVPDDRPSKQRKQSNGNTGAPGSRMFKQIQSIISRKESVESPVRHSSSPPPSVHSEAASQESSKNHKAALPVYPQMSAQPGVDPFALLRSCAGAKWKMQGDIEARFAQLRARFDRCDKKRLVQQTAAIFADQRLLRCTLCRQKIDSANNLVEHICSKRHIEVMGGVVCTDAFDFWYNAIDTVTEPGMKPEPVFGGIAEPGMKPEPVFCGIAAPGMKTEPVFGGITEPAFVGPPVPPFGMWPGPGFFPRPSFGMGPGPRFPGPPFGMGPGPGFPGPPFGMGPGPRFPGPPFGMGPGPGFPGPPFGMGPSPGFVGPPPPPFGPWLNPRFGGPPEPGFMGRSVLTFDGGPIRDKDIEENNNSSQHLGSTD